MIRYVVLTLLLAALPVLAFANPGGAAPSVPQEKIGHPDAGTEPATAGVDATATTAEDDAGDTADASADEEQAGDDESFPKKKHGHEPWEHALALPGYIVYLPFWAVFTATGASIKFFEKTGAIDRAMDIITFNEGRGGIYPAYAGRTGAGLTFFLKDYLNEDFRFDATATYGFLDRSMFRVRYRRLEIFNGALITGLNVQYRNMPDELFFGIGPDTPKDPKTNYRRTLALGELTLGRRLGEDLDLNLVGAVEHNTIYDGRNSRYASTLDEFPGLPGADEELTFGSIGLRAEWDGRNSDFRPSGGSLFILDSSIDRQVNGDDFGFTSVLAEYRHFILLWHNRVLMLRVNGWLTDPLEGRMMPFYKLPSHGHEATVRGYRRDRWRDNDAVLASIEYRWPVWRVIDALLFTDASHVAGNIFEEFDGGKIKYSYGGGFRLYSRGDTDTWMLFAKSDDGFSFHFRLN